MVIDHGAGWYHEGSGESLGFAWRRARATV